MTAMKRDALRPVMAELGPSRCIAGAQLDQTQSARLGATEIRNKQFRVLVSALDPEGEIDFYSWLGLKYVPQKHQRGQYRRIDRKVIREFQTRMPPREYGAVRRH